MTRSILLYHLLYAQLFLFSLSFQELRGNITINSRLMSEDRFKMSFAKVTGYQRNYTSTFFTCQY